MASSDKDRYTLPKGFAGSGMYSACVRGTSKYREVNDPESSSHPVADGNW